MGPVTGYRGTLPTPQFARDQRGSSSARTGQHINSVKEQS